MRKLQTGAKRRRGQGRKQGGIERKTKKGTGKTYMQIAEGNGHSAQRRCRKKLTEASIMPNSEVYIGPYTSIRTFL